MTAENSILSLENPAFFAYMLAASIMLLKLLLQPWITVFRMMKVRGGFRSPEDLRKSPLNPDPDPGQLEPNEYVERSRRMNLNDLESIPAFLIAQLHDVRATCWTFSSVAVLAMVGYMLVWIIGH